jgi:phosphatidylserine/phosphatidylglycerophosphate/cardiolipin synthase-like enzyme
VAGGSHAVQVLRTYPRKWRPYPFARNGERSVARAYLKAFARARSFVYIEDQYLWSFDAAGALHEALVREPELRVVVIVPGVPERDHGIAAAPNRIDQVDAVARLRAAAPDRVAIYSLESSDDFPIYVHAKVCIVDDVWMTVGSDNLNRRSWTNDSELCCAVIDEQRDERSPRDPAGLGDCARLLARETRLRLWREHLERDYDDLVDAQAGYRRLAAAAAALDGWHRDGRRGPRPAGRLRRHEPEPVNALARPFARAFARTVVDPDGRPRALRRAHRF